jgi:hypothetical protein
MIDVEGGLDIDAGWGHAKVGTLFGEEQVLIDAMGPRQFVITVFGNRNRAEALALSAYRDAGPR